MSPHTLARAADGRLHASTGAALRHLLHGISHWIGRQLMAAAERRLEHFAARELDRLDERLLTDIGLQRRPDGGFEPACEGRCDARPGRSIPTDSYH